MCRLHAFNKHKQRYSDKAFKGVSAVQLTTEESLESFWQSQLPTATPAANLSDTSSDVAQQESISIAARPDSNQVQRCHSPATPQFTPSSAQHASSLPNARTNLLVQRLYRHKLDQLGASPATVLCRCSQCSTVFAALHRHKFPCSQDCATGDGTAELHVISSRHHVADKTWKAQR